MTMRTNRGLITCAGLCLFLSAVSHGADEVTVTLTKSINEGALFTETLFFDAGEDIGITIPPRYGVPRTRIHQIRITTVGGNDNTLDDVGLVTVTGDVDSSEVVEILLAGTETQLPLFPSVSISPGAKHWKGVKTVDTGVDGSLEEGTLLAASITGNISGEGSEVSVGTVYRLQAINNNLSLGGSIDADIKSYYRYQGRLGFASGCIEYIVASNRISGDITTANAVNDATNITSVVVGPSPNAEGISGRILAPLGYIRQIISSGPISIPSTPSSPGIQAGQQIELIYAGVPTLTGDPDPTAPRDISAVIDCGARGGNEDILYNIRTAGDLNESVIANALGTDPAEEDRTEVRGIFVGGSINAPITITDFAYLAIIQAETFGPNANITIGTQLKGLIEATDPINGHLRDITIGRNPLLGSGLSLYGMDGYTSPSTGYPLGDPEAVIRAVTIDKIDIHTVGNSGKTFSPRIEADLISDIKIESFQTGFISGYDGGPTKSQLVTARFGAFEYASSDISYPLPTLYAKSFSKLSVDRGMGGIIELDVVSDDKALIIGDGMTAQVPSYNPTDGQIIISGDAEGPGLRGSIILNENYTTPSLPSVFNTGPVIVTPAVGSPLSFSAGASQPTQMAQYTQLSPPLGGGCIGLPPFAAHLADCSPPSSSENGPRLLYQSQFSDIDGCNVAVPGVTLRFYGPVRTELESGNPVKLEWVQRINGELFYWELASFTYTTTMKRGGTSGFDNEIVVKGADNWWFMPGRYRITPKNTTYNGKPAVYSDGVTSSPAVQDFVYEFWLKPDCNCDLVDDLPTDCLPPSECPCPADFNNDGGVTGDDVEAFFVDWAQGLETGDTNCDGGVNGNDVETFFIAWESGGCE